MKRFIPRQSVSHFKGEFGLILRIFFTRDCVTGDALSELESKIADYIGTRHAVLVPSVTFGMYQILKSAVDKDSEVICPAFSHYSIPQAIILTGAKPVFADIEYDTLNISPHEVEQRLTDKTKAIIVGHFGGYPVDLQPILDIAKARNVFVFADCAHAFGAEYAEKKVGVLEDAACFSFGSGKNLDGFGGGVVTTNNDFIAGNIREQLKLCKWPNRIEILKKIGRAYIQWSLMKQPIFEFITLPMIWLTTIWDKESDVLFALVNKIPTQISDDLVEKRSRFSNIQAKIVMRHLQNIDSLNEKVRNNAFLLTQRLFPRQDISLTLELPKTKAVFLLYPVKVKNKADFVRKLLKAGIDVRRKYLGSSCTKMGLFREFSNQCPVAERLPDDLVYLPVYASLTEQDIARIAQSIEEALGSSTLVES